MLRSYARPVWRIVEAQHRISTNRLADDPAAQARLEQLVEDVKPTMPDAALGLHFLLASPFRYWHAAGTRFRRAGVKPGIFYASETEETALAETAYWRLRFFAAAPAMTRPQATSEHSAFTVSVRTAKSLDLTAPPLDAGDALWMRKDDYAPCQRFADHARALDTEIIVYRSVRDDSGGRNAAILAPRAFAGEPDIRTTWHFRFEGDRLTAQAAFPARRTVVFHGESKR
ncbi:RES family NAD+ phosphorylase [Pacificimonas sp. WHA3]|uniref:RES family NAD+ phosphorylase n=2 Tax=Pacificimonas pallii TaxID=2827236 RepID=A0ABS6SHW4_9SPHN|nr:RES family NAD+ phosphorylase [Pacificimonas pallii]MBV7257643.1 RES family NAD+ phosphorylase [Pacificimonas pallii]